MSDFRLILADPSKAICEAWRKEFDSLPNVEIQNRKFEELEEFDCIVSAANSFGQMDGGIDLALAIYFGDELQRTVQRRILEQYLGEQPVGTCMIVETGNPLHPYLAHTPTMRVPMPISRTDNVYSAMWAMLVAVYSFSRTREEPIRSVVCPGLGTGYGRMPARESARQMSVAYRHYLDRPHSIGWSYGLRIQQDVVRGGDFGLMMKVE